MTLALAAAAKSLRNAMEDKIQEFKIKYNHSKAKLILNKLRVEFIKEELLEDFYIVDDGKNIYKLARIDGQLKFIHLVHERGGFKLIFMADINEKRAGQELVQLFDHSEQVMHKRRKHYKWCKSTVVLDNIEGLGEFVEFYPASTREKIDLFKAFGVKDHDLIKESYYSLWKQCKFKKC